MTIVQVPVREAIAEWDFYEKMIGKILRRADVGSTTEDVLTCLQEGKMQLWRDATRRGIAVTQIQVYPLFKVLLIFMVAGRDVQDWLKDGHQQLDSFARDSGCKYVDFIGRRGWAKLVRDFGYDKEFIWLRRTVGVDSCSAETDR